MKNTIRCNSRRLLWAVTCWAILFSGCSNILLAQTGSQSSTPKIMLFRILPTIIKDEQWYEFHWEVINTHRVKLFKDGREMGGRAQLPDGSIGWPLSMSGSFRSKLTKMATYELVAENRAGESVSKKFTVKVAASKPPPAPRIISFRVSPTTVKPGGWIKFYWEVENAESVRLYDDVGEIVDKSRRGWDFQEIGAFSTTLRRTTKFRLLAEGRAGRRARKTFTVRVAGSIKPEGTCSISGKLTGKWRQRIRERPSGPGPIWKKGKVHIVEVRIYVADSRKPVARASVNVNNSEIYPFKGLRNGIYSFKGLKAGKEYTVRPVWASSPRQGNVSCTPGQTHKGPEFKITGRPLID